MWGTTLVCTVLYVKILDRNYKQAGIKGEREGGKKEKILSLNIYGSFRKVQDELTADLWTSLASKNGKITGKWERILLWNNIFKSVFFSYVVFETCSWFTGGLYLPQMKIFTWYLPKCLFISIFNQTCISWTLACLRCLKYLWQYNSSSQPAMLYFYYHFVCLTFKIWSRTSLPSWRKEFKGKKIQELEVKALKWCQNYKMTFWKEIVW